MDLVVVGVRFVKVTAFAKWRVSGSSKQRNAPNVDNINPVIMGSQGVDMFIRRPLKIGPAIFESILPAPTNRKLTALMID